MSFNRVKLVVVGDGGCGKTALIYCYSKKHFKEEYVPTVLDVYLCEFKLQGQKWTMEIVDTAGQEQLANIRQLTYPDTSCFLMCYDCTSRTSLSNLKKFWAAETTETYEGTPFVMIGNKLDLVKKSPEDAVTETMAKKTLAEMGGYDHFQCSAMMEGLGQDPSKTVDKAFKTGVQLAVSAQADGGGGGCCVLL